MSDPVPAATPTRQSASEDPECPACRAAEEGLVALVGRVRRDEAGDVDWLSVCNTHAWQLCRWPDLAKQLVTARLQTALDRLGQASGVSAGGRVGKRRQPVSFGDDGLCPLCGAMAAAARVTLDALAASGDEVAALCLPHLCLALELADGRNQVRRLARAARRRYVELEHDLSELIRKSDYRFRGEPRGREATSWTLAARLLAGAPGVRWGLRKDPRIES